VGGSGTEKPEARVEDGMEEFFSEVDTAADMSALWRVFRSYFLAMGITRIAAVHFPPVGAPDQDQGMVRLEGFSAEWTDRYLTEGRQADDPIRAQASVNAVPFRWSDIRRLRTLTPAQEAFLEEFVDLHHGARDGIAIPVFGPGGRNGYVALGLPDGLKDIPPELIQRCQVAAQYCHQRYCELVARQLGDFQTLSPRELEVLGWVARGKSNSVIAEIIGVSANTVDTHLRRIYGKLRVSDRVSAALAGLGHGLISMP
jgi:LuxR family transcriptional regulator/LuxR family quorum-sensing system transcriptional regulator CciR